MLCMIGLSDQLIYWNAFISEYSMQKTTFSLAAIWNKRQINFPL